MAEREQWRVFCAVDLTHEVREKVLAHGMRLRKEVSEAHVTWSRPDSIHLTIKFIGEVPQTRVESLSKAAADASSGLDSFPISVQGSGVFPNHREPRVLWIGIEDLKGKLCELYRRLEEECAKAGFKKEVRPFHPHLTLARVRKPQHARTLASIHQDIQFEPVEVKISEVLVIRSQLGSEGSKYTVVSRHPLS